MLLISVFIFVLGLALGSFIFTTATRLQDGVSLLTRSSCDFCREKISIVGLIPILGFILLRAKCSKCGVKIAGTYPLTEIANGVLVLIIFTKTGLSIEFVYAILIFELLLLIAIIDFRSHLIFPQPIIIGLVIQSVWLFFFLQTELLNALLGLFLGAGIFHWVSYLYQVIRKRTGLGAGDATLLGLIGFLFGWKILLPIIFWAAVFGILGGGIILLIKKQSLAKEIAFGPWLVLAAFLCWRIPDFFQSFPVKIPNFNALLF
ncbi:prepilin peptidase [bacterium]|nr:prepilin peptidase [bacterium]